MKSLRDQSIQRKLALGLASTGAVTLLVAAAAFFAEAYFSFRSDLISNLHTQAEITADSTAALLAFEDPDTATETLALLKADPHVMAACVYASDGQVFAQYARADLAGTAFPVPEEGELHRFERGYLETFHPIRLGNKNIGTLYLRSDLAQLRTRLFRYLGIVGLVFVISLLAVFWLAARFQRMIAQPILLLAKAAGKVADGETYAIRVESSSRDEVGTLVKAFNEMLGQIEQREASLKAENAERKQAEMALSASEARLVEAQRIAKMGSWELDLRTNTLSWSEEVFRLFEVDPAEFGATYESFLAAVHPDDRERINAAYTKSIRERQPYQIVHRVNMADGGIRYVEEQCESDFDADGTPLFSRGTVQDVTDRVSAEETIHRSLEEKETLLREIHHRVKNNLQIISSLLYFQCKKVKDLEAVMVFDEIRERLRSMVLVHEKLYRSDDLAALDIADYLESLVAQLQKSAAAAGRPIQFRVEVASVQLPIEVALPCGMILVELLTNVVKYAFPDGRSGEATVSLAVNDGLAHLKVSDNGVGMPPDFDPGNTNSFGWKLIQSLTNQLDGTVSLNQDGGTCVGISFPHGSAPDASDRLAGTAEVGAVASAP